jgi:hypothetical protein
MEKPKVEKEEQEPTPKEPEPENETPEGDKPAKKKRKRKRKRKKKKAKKIIFEVTNDSKQTGYKPLLAYEPKEEDYKNFETEQDNSIIRNLGREMGYIV